MVVKDDKRLGKLPLTLDSKRGVAVLKFHPVKVAKKTWFVDENRMCPVLRVSIGPAMLMKYLRGEDLEADIAAHPS